MSEELKKEGEEIVVVPTETTEGTQPKVEDIYKKDLEKEQNRSGYQNRKKLEGADDIVEERVNKRLEEFEKRMRSEKEADVIASVASNEDEAELIKYHLNETIKRTDSLAEDIKRAKFLANQSKYEQIEKELPAISAAQRTGNRSSGASYGSEVSKAETYSDRERALMARFNIDPETGKVLSKK